MKMFENIIITWGLYLSKFELKSDGTIFFFFFFYVQQFKAR